MAVKGWKGILAVVLISNFVLRNWFKFQFLPVEILASKITMKSRFTPLTVDMVVFLKFTSD